MAAIPIFKESNERGERENFYVPHFELRIAGRKLKYDTVRDVMQVTYHDSIEEIDSFELTINNWDAQEGAFKYEPPSLPEYKTLFDPGQKVELSMGYLDNLRLMLVGEITTIEPNYPETGAPTLAVRGLNVLHTFRKQQHTYSWEGKRYSEIALEIGSSPVTKDKPGLGVNVQVSRKAMDKEPKEEFVYMNNQFDILFLLQMARKLGYSLYLDLDENGEQFLYFGPALDLRNVTYELEWGKTLSSFRPTLTTVNQIEEVTVRGWDRRAKKPIEGHAKLGEGDAATINADQTSVASAIKGRHEVITSEPVRDQKAADALAGKILRDQLQEMVKAAGATVGLPDLRAGRKLNIKKLGSRIDGEYFVVDSTHTINDSGYRTTFNARREKG